MGCFRGICNLVLILRGFTVTVRVLASDIVHICKNL